jgi:hypothetical protein
MKDYRVQTPLPNRPVRPARNRSMRNRRASVWRGSLRRPALDASRTPKRRPQPGSRSSQVRLLLRATSTAEMAFGLSLEGSGQRGERTRARGARASSCWKRSRGEGCNRPRPGGAPRLGPRAASRVRPSDSVPSGPARRQRAGCKQAATTVGRSYNNGPPVTTEKSTILHSPFQHPGRRDRGCGPSGLKSGPFAFPLPRSAAPEGSGHA